MFTISTISHHLPHFGNFSSLAASFLLTNQGVLAILWPERGAVRYHAEPAFSFLQRQASRGIQSFALRHQGTERFRPAYGGSWRRKNNALPRDARAARRPLCHCPHP